MERGSTTDLAGFAVPTTCHMGVTRSTENRYNCGARVTWMCRHKIPPERNTKELHSHAA